MELFNVNISDLIIDTTSFLNEQIYVIDQGLDWPACSRMSYAEWIQSYTQFSNIKINGLESNPKLMRRFSHQFNKTAKDCHLFINQLGGQSFDWHRDELDVILLVVKGRKRVYTNKGAVSLCKGKSTYIPAGRMHKVVSIPGTVALSFGL